VLSLGGCRVHDRVQSPLNPPHCVYRADVEHSGHILGERVLRPTTSPGRLGDRESEGFAVAQDLSSGLLISTMAS
jgi:hypothetical protein